MDYSSDSDSENIVFVAEDGSVFTEHELENLLLTRRNPRTGTDLTEGDITALHQMLLEGPDSEDGEIETVDYQPFFKYPYLSMYTLMVIQLGYIIWSIY